MYGEEVARIGWVKLQFLPKFENLVVDAARGGIVVVTPDVSEELFARDNTLGVVKEEAEELEFVCGETDVLVVLPDQHFGEIDLALTESDGNLGRVLLILLLVLIQPAQRDLHAGEKFAGTEGLGD